MDTDKEKGEPLGRPEQQGRGDARPEGSGDEGGLGFVGDQRGAGEEDPPLLDVDTREGTPIRQATEEDAEQAPGQGPTRR